MGANRICMESGFIPEVNVGCGPILLDPAWQDISFSWGDKTRITLHPDGSVEIDPEWAIDETAKFFWNAVMRVAGGEPKFPEAVSSLNKPLRRHPTPMI